MGWYAARARSGDSGGPAPRKAVLAMYMVAVYGVVSNDKVSGGRSRPMYAAARRSLIACRLTDRPDDGGTMILEPSKTGQ